MTDFTAVAPPQSTIPGGYDPSSAFADALQRARQIAAKINTPGGDSTVGGGTKRALEDSMDHLTDGTPEAKKIAAVNDPFGAQLAAMQQQRGKSVADPLRFQQFPETGQEKNWLAAAPQANGVTVEEWKVPDKMVGLIIGRGGEQISRMQAESGCKIQMAPDSGGASERVCTLTGTRQAIDKAKELIGQIVNRGGTSITPIDPNHLPEGHAVVEMLIPGSKVGLVIGKGGETIRNLQERAGVKMIMIQDGPQQSSLEKPLRISGEPQKCEYAKQLVMDLITEKELENIQRGGFIQTQTNDYGTTHGGGAHEVMVPQPAVGVVIGKGGDMIKRIQQDSGAKVQFQQGKDDAPGDRICLVSGNPEEIQKASGIINDLIRSVLVRDQQGGGTGRGRGRGRNFDGSGGPFGGGPGMGRGRGREDAQEVQYTVPAGKCGLVIGKGGETIRGINQQSGAHVELSRAAPPNPHEKVFIIRGNPQQIEHAQQLINERIGAPAGPNGQTPPGPYPTQYPQHYQQPPPPPQPYAPQGWGNAYQHWQNQAAAPNDPTKAAADANAAAWAAYYAQYYSQTQQQQPPQQPPQQQQPQQQPPQAAVAAAAPGGQPDYSAAWVEYYRSLGMYREAEMIEQQARANQQAAQQAGQPYPQQPQQQYAQQPQPPTAGGPGAPPGPSPNPNQGAPAPPPQPQQQQQQPPAAAAQPPQPSQPQAPTAPGPAPPPQGQQYPGGPGAPPGQWPPGAAYPQQPYTQQQAPYPGYNYAAAYGAQQYPGTTQ